MEMKKSLLLLIVMISYLFIPLWIESVWAESGTDAGYRSIIGVKAIKVESPVGTVPRLPYRVLVDYSDGQREYRQVRWNNSSSAVERNMADSAVNPVGKTYRIRGYIVGDNTTPNGYPIMAEVEVVNGGYQTPSSIPKARPLALNKVKILGDNRLTSNRDLAIDEIISWDVSQQLYNYRDTYGLSTEGYTVSDGWDSPTTKLKGHGSGHYMSSLALAFACCDEREKRDILRRNIKRMVDELRYCQERTFVWSDELGRYFEARDFAPEEELRFMKGEWKDFDNYKKQYRQYGYGYLNAIPAHHAVLIEMYRPYNNSSWVWAPYYAIHKQLAGLIDIATYIDDPAIADKALLIAKDMGLWVWNRMHYRTYLDSSGSQEQRRAKPGNRYEMWNMYIAGEVGGMSESLARLSEMVDDSLEKERLLEAANCFDSPAFYDPLAVGIDSIRTRHANQHIPMIVGALRSYRSNKNPYYYNLAENFWDMIQGRYRYACGGVGNGEMFRQPYTQILSMAGNVTSDGEGNLYPSPTLNETCCAYNLAKLTKELNCFCPDDARYMDYYERVLYNQIVGSLNPVQYMTTYHYAMGLNASKPWGNRTPQESCCGGTGSENHVKYQEAAYFVSDDTLWIGLYLPTEAQWDEKKVTIYQDCLWPAEKSTLRIKSDVRPSFAMKLRVPYWCTAGFDVKLNGVSMALRYEPGSYIAIPYREWDSSDVVEIIMPFRAHVDFGPDKMEMAAAAKNEPKKTFEPMWVGALMYGPLVMVTQGIENWEEAEVDICSDWSDVQLLGAQPGEGSDANVYSLSFVGRKFWPDYYIDRNSTHYLRMNLLGDPSKETRERLKQCLGEMSSYNQKCYTAASFEKFKETVRIAERLYTARILKEEEAENSIAAVRRAVEELETVGIDKEPLKEILDQVKRLESHLYTDESYIGLQEFCAAAERMLENEIDAQQTLDLLVYELKKAREALVFVADIDKTVLQELLELASARKEAQEAWLSLNKKVPEFPPWAPHGYARLMTQYHLAQNVYDNIGRRYSQEETDKAAGALNAAINTMRPGNLAELEDLTELLKLIENLKADTSSVDETVRTAIEYAEKVVEYVSDGSGTLDMIQEAKEKLLCQVRAATAE